MAQFPRTTVHASIKKLFHPSRFKQFRNPWDRAKVAGLPIEYQQFYTEWMDSEDLETPVHWIPREVKWRRNRFTGQVRSIQNVAIHVNYPTEMHEGLWGGEGVVQGTVKKGKWRSPVPRFWTPNLKRSIVFSEILNQYFSVVVTERALKLIDDYHGLDNYLMLTPAYDLKSLLALKLKRYIMIALANKDFCKDDPTRQQELLEKYQEYILPPNELKWYGLSVDEAIEQLRKMKEAEHSAIPLKTRYRQELIEELQRKRDSPEEENKQDATHQRSWISKFNPFAKRE